MPREPLPETHLRHGLIESAGGQLKCPVCRELLEDVLMVSTTTGRQQTMVLPLESRVYEAQPQAEGIRGVVVGMACAHDHHVYLSLVAADGYITVKTEWEAEQGEQRERD